MSAYVYIRSEPGLYTVGFYDPGGKWHPESDHNSTDAAAARAALLNGNCPDLLPPLTASIAIVKERDAYKKALRQVAISVGHGDAKDIAARALAKVRP